MSANLEMLAADYERRAKEQREAAEIYRASNRANYVRACQANARRYEKEASAYREIIERNRQANAKAGAQ